MPISHNQMMMFGRYIRCMMMWWYIISGQHTWRVVYNKKNNNFWQQIYSWYNVLQFLEVCSCVQIMQNWHKFLFKTIVSNCGIKKLSSVYVLVKSGPEQRPKLVCVLTALTKIVGLKRVSFWYWGLNCLWISFEQFARNW